jgi:hypothetical protein
MNNRIKSLGLLAFYIAAVFFVGCIPENSLEWSDDGSVGLLRVDGALFMVDGKNGQLTVVTQEYVQPWPSISKDGGLIAYSPEVDCNSLSEGLKLLPPGQVKMIQYNAKRMGEEILEAGGLGMIDKFPDPYDELLESEDYRNWVIRYMVENADKKLLDILGEEGIKLAGEKDLQYYQVVVVPGDNLEDKRVIASTIFRTFMTRISPDNRYVAYVMQTQYGDEEMEYSLYVASLKSEIKNVLVDERVALGYDWRQDSRAIAYINADTENLGEDEMALGTLEERIIADDKNKPLTKPIELDKDENGSVESYKCTSDVSSLAGLVFYPWLKVRYGLDGRIFFSTCLMPLPMSTRDEPGWSLFCYDSVTGMVTNVLPQSVSVHTSQAMNMLQFELSPDGKKVLLPIKNNKFVGYEFGTDRVGLPIFDDEGFGEEDFSALVPTFKGNDEISFLVSEDSHYYGEAQQEKRDRYEIVVLEINELEGRILSESWPDEIMNEFEQEN